ncbi:MAG TPA: hypothetical protein VIL35_11715 [Vicinamibacterales bacterium]
MDEALLVQRLQRAEDGQRDADGLVLRQHAAQQPARQRFALEELHGDEEVLAFLAHVEHLADVRVADAGGGAGLPPQAIPGAPVQPVAAQHLHRDTAMQPRIEGGVHEAHAAFAEQPVHPEGTNRRSHVGRSILASATAAGAFRGASCRASRRRARQVGRRPGASLPRHAPALVPANRRVARVVSC